MAASNDPGHRLRLGRRGRPPGERRPGRSRGPGPRVAAVLAIAAASGVGAGAVPGGLAAQKSLVIESFESDIQVQTSGAVVVTETLRPRFRGSWNGILRDVSTRHTTAAGERERLDIQLLSATDGAGRPLRHEVERPDGDTRRFRVWVPDARDRTAVVVIRYRVDGAIRYFASDSTGPGQDYDELYWEVTGTEWEVPIEVANVRVAIPVGAEPLQYAAYYGRTRSNTRAPVSIGDAGAISVADVGPLPPGEGLTIAVAWPAGIVAQPAGVSRSAPVTFGPEGSAPARAAIPVGSASPVALLPLLLPFLVFYLAHRAWDRRGRDPKKRAITVHWEPPEDLNPAETGTLIDHDPGMHDIVSTLVDLAVRGYVVIAERERKGFLKFGKDYVFHLIRPRSEWGDLTRHETLFLNGLFEGSARSEVLANLAEEGSFLDTILETVGGEPASDTAPEGALDSVLLSDLQNEFYTKLPSIKDAILDALVRKGHYARRPDRVRTRWFLTALGAFAIGFVGIAGITSGTATGLVAGVAMLIAGVASALVLGVFAFLMPARTEKGARTREAALGFRQFLERVESPRYRRMISSPAQFEEYLPYAMAFRCEDKWAKAFDDLLTEPPNWYHGHYGTFRPSAFAGDLGTLASTAGSTMASSPSSSGSGGGGSVGGGSGGGGGGGF
jgi:uncharacterized membrane protein YgcG